MKRVLLFLLLIAPAVYAKEPLGKKVSIKTTDGRKLAGVFVPPQKGKPIVILLHGLGSVKEEWKPFVEQLTLQGLGSLAYDARGHGESSKTQSKDGAATEYQSYQSVAPWKKMAGDCGAVVHYLKGRGYTKRPYFICGASLGANVALNTAAQSPLVKAAILLSPGIQYAGVETLEFIKKIKIPPLIVASAKDSYAYNSSLKLSREGHSVVMIENVPPGHGVGMFDEKLMLQIIDWIGRQ